jgi:peptidyl-dipeptidase Dcp
VIETTNPLLVSWNTPLGLPPFGLIKAEHFAEAFATAMAAHRDEIESIANNPQASTFGNTVVALDRSGQLFDTTYRIFSNLCAAETNNDLQNVEREMAPKLAAHHSAIAMHAGLFARVAAVHQQRSDLDPIAQRLVERLYLDAVRSGALLTGLSRDRAGAIAEQLATLQTQFAQNVLADERWSMPLPNPDDLDGLPDWLVDALREAGTQSGVDHPIVTLSRSLVTPFLVYSARRDLREIAWKAWITRGEHEGPSDNRPLISQILALRVELAKLHGYATFADYQIDDMMAKTPEAVSGLLNQVWAPARSAAIAEYEELSSIARTAGIETVEGWDWRFFAEQVKTARYALSDDEVMAYFTLDGVLNAAFDCASRLFGLTFVERSDVLAYHPDVRVFEFREHGELRGIFLSDNFARSSKRSGAWMSTYRSRAAYLEGFEGLPVVANHNNFAKGSLLSGDDARTLFHEFGHGLHAMLSDSPYQRLGGVQVLRDFVELPSQLFEHWITEPEVLKRHALHHETGEPIPDELLEKMRQAQYFNQGFDTVEYVVSALIDQAVHAQTEPIDMGEFERKQLAELGMPPAMVMRHRPTHFQHLFASSGYAAAYYVYLWAEVLDADAYDAFIEAGSPFDPDTAKRLRTYIYSSGNTLEPGHAYRSFRGRDAGIEPLLRGRGLL